MTSKFLYDMLVDICDSYPQVFRASWQLGFYLEDMLTGNTRFFHNSHNTSILQPEYIYINRKTRAKSYREARKRLEESESDRFMTHLLQQYAESSRSVNATPIVCVLHCILLRQKIK